LTEYTNVTPDLSIPQLWCDFNAWGLSGEANDNCYYSLHREELGRIGSPSGARVFIYDDDIADDGQPEVFGCVAVLEPVSFRGKAHIRARPVAGPWYRGPKFWGAGA